MTGLTVMKNLRPSYNKSLIMTRLRYDKNKTELPAEVQNELDRLFKRAESILNITAAYRLVDITNINSPEITLEDGTVLSGKGLSKLLDGCDQALLMLATGGKKIMEEITSLQKDGRMSEAVVIDAAASEITDSALDVVMSHVEQMLRSRGRTLTKARFSPGYGDFDITQQAVFFRLLEAAKFDLVLNDAFLLIPEKSVFAIAGIAGGM